MGTNFNYDDTDHQVIFDNINGGAGSQPLQELSRAWKQLAEDIGVTAKEYVEAAIRGILTAREGAAADAAAAGTGTMLPWMDDAATTADAVARRVQEQAHYWVTAKDSVPPVSPAPQSASFFGDPTEWVAERMDWLPGLTTEEEKAEQRRQDAAEQARQAMRVYQASSNGNLDAAPVFTPPQGLDGRVEPTPSPGAPGGTGGGAAGGSAGAPGTSAQPMMTPAPQLRSGPVPPPVRPQQAAPGAAPGPAGAASGATQAPSPTPGQGVAPAPGIGSGRQDRVPGRGLGDPAVGRSGSGRAAGGVGVGRFPGGAGGFGPGGGGSAPRFGPRPGVTPAPAEEAAGGLRGGGGAAAKGAGASGYAPLGMMPGQGAGQDRDHRRRFLVESESNAIVGDLPPTAPPVIGADQDD